MSFAISLNPNEKIDPTNIVPDWPLFSNGSSQMVFNRTEAGEPDIQLTPVDEALLERCRYVCRPIQNKLVS
jgi:hypothetical protein